MRPLDFSGLEVDAAEAGFLGGVAVDSVEVAVNVEAGGHLGAEVAAFPEGFGVFLVHFEESGAFAVAGGDESVAVFGDDGVSGIDPVAVSQR